jgi:hypothetical protein
MKLEAKARAPCKKKRKQNHGGLPSPQRVEQMLLATSFPRLHMVLILSLAAVGSFLTSASLVALGLHSMAARYALAVVGGYFFFLASVRGWIAYQTRNWSFGRRTGQRATEDAQSFDLDLVDIDIAGNIDLDLGRIDLPDLSALSSADAVFSGGGGGFGGAGASGSFDGDVTGDGSLSDALDGASSGDGEGVAIVVAAVALLGGLLALGFVVYSSPILLAEVLLDVAVVGALYRKNQRHERGHWAAGVLGRTYKPALVLAVLAVIFGAAIQSLAPKEHTLGAVLRAHDAAKNRRSTTTAEPSFPRR